jgi:predicted RNase H-like nuclease
MFGLGAPVWPFLARFGGAADPLAAVADTRVYETYPVLAMIALGWTLPDPTLKNSRPTGRLPKYNPERRKTFSVADWRHVCRLTSNAFCARELMGIVQWLGVAALQAPPRKSDQDRLDACLCLLVALHLAERKHCLMVGDLQSGYIVVPDDGVLRTELEARCRATGRAPSQWVRVFQIPRRIQG